MLSLAFFSHPLQAPHNVQKQRMQKKKKLKEIQGDENRGRGRVSFSIHLTMEG